MKLPQQLPLLQLLNDIAKLAFRTHIRLALSREGEGRWVARSLLIDAFPATLVEKAAGVSTDYKPPTFLYDFQGLSLFYANMIAVKDLLDWFRQPEDCLLRNFDSRPGERSRVQQFHLPEMFPDVNGMHLYSRRPGVYATLPWPLFDYRAALKEANLYHPGDNEPLHAPGQRHFDNFREARALLIRDKSGNDRNRYQDQDEIEVRVIDGDGWIENVEVVRSPSSARFAVTVAGLGITPGYVILKDDGDLFLEQQVTGPGTAVFERPAPLPAQLTFVVANATSPDLDQAWYAPVPSPIYSSSSHIHEITTRPASKGPKPSSTKMASPARSLATTSRVSEETGDTGKRPSSRSVAATNRPTEEAREVKTLRVVMVSPKDVVLERACLPDVIDELNRGLAAELGLRLELWRWETDTYPDFHPNGPQGQIDESMDIEAVDIVVGVFWQRFGTPVADDQSGTAHELRRAQEARHKSGGDRPHIMLYFNRQPPELKTLADIDQYRAVREFQGQMSKAGLWWSYQASTEFEKLLRLHLQQLLRQKYRKS